MLRYILLATAMAILLTACSGTTTPDKEITLDMTDFSYNFPSISISADEPVTITLVNKGLVEHDFVIEKIDARMTFLQDSGSEVHHAHGEESDFDVHASAQVDTTTVIELTVLEPGTYQFFCSVEGHKEAGMIGELIVVDQE